MLTRRSDTQSGCMSLRCIKAWSRCRYEGSPPSDSTATDQHVRHRYEHDEQGKSQHASLHKSQRFVRSVHARESELRVISHSWISHIVHNFPRHVFLSCFTAKKKKSSVQKNTVFVLELKSNSFGKRIKDKIEKDSSFTKLFLN